MVKWSPELRTESTGTTVGHTVEASGEANASSSGSALSYVPSSSEGGSGGEETSAVNPAWARALHSRAACQLGRCAYADPTRRPDRHIIGLGGCDGYHANEHIDAEGVVTVRWYLCPRHREWWRHERQRVAAAKRER